MEFQEKCHEYCNNGSQDITQLNEKTSEKNLTVSLGVRKVERIYLPLDSHQELVEKSHHDVVCSKKNVDQQEQEVFAVPEANAIVDPWAMMIHVQDASIACRAMMASFRFEHIAHQAIAASLILCITKMESPEHWNLTGISGHRLKERPHKHQEQQMKDC